MNNTSTTTVREHLITLLNDYHSSFLGIEEFAHHQVLHLNHATALLWLASEIEKHPPSSTPIYDI